MGNWRQKWELVKKRERYLIHEIRPAELTVHLGDVLTDEDCQAIEAAQKQNGSIFAARTQLVPRLRRRGPESFPSFVVALRKAGFSHAAQLLDPHCEVNEKCPSGRKEEALLVPGVVADIRVEVNLNNHNGEHLFDVEKSICQTYGDSTSPETIKLREHFLEYLGKKSKLDLVFVKTTSTEAKPLIFIFRLSDRGAAEKLWNDFENGDLESAVEKTLSSFEGLANVFASNSIKTDVEVVEENYEKVVGTLSVQHPQNLVRVDGMEKKELILEEFQTKLAKPAFEGRNTIVCSPTGTGKTFVAMAAIQERLKSVDGQKIVFVVNTVSLVQQQQHCLETYLPDGVFVSSLCGSNPEVVLWDVLKDNDVVVVTAQVLLNALDKDRGVTLSKLSLLVFDECHHTKGRNPYNQIMRWYMREKHGGRSPHLPQVIGLSASLGIGTGNNGCGTKAEQHIMEICANLDAHELQVYEESRQTTETNVISISRRQDGAFHRAVNRAMSEIEELLLSSCELIEKVPSPRGCQSYENWAVKLRQRDLGRDLMTCAEHLDEYNSALMINSEIRTKDALIYLHEKMKCNGSIEVEVKLRDILEKTRKAAEEDNECGQETNPGLQKLEELLLKKFSSDDAVKNSKGIVFVGTRLVASALVNWIQTSSKLKLVVMKPTRLIGCGLRNGKDGMAKARQDQAIKDFRDGDCNVIIATSALLEGIDIPRCNFAINYGMPGNEITLVQARGRVRTQGKSQGSYTYDVIVPHEQRSLKERDLSKENLMKDVIAKVENMPKDEFQKEVNRLQAVAYREHLNLLTKQSSRRKDPVTDNVKLYCKKCGAFACEARHVHVYRDAHHLVSDYTLNLKHITVKEGHAENMPGKLGLKVAEISCVSCGQEWGSLTQNRLGKFPLLKICHFRVKNYPNNEGEVFKKWKQFPYQLKKIDFSDENVMSMAPES